MQHPDIANSIILLVYFVPIILQSSIVPTHTYTLDGTYTVGDSVYPLWPNVIAPYFRRTKGDLKKNLYKVNSSTRMVIERICDIAEFSLRKKYFYEHRLDRDWLQGLMNFAKVTKKLKDQVIMIQQQLSLQFHHLHRQHHQLHQQHQQLLDHFGHSDQLLLHQHMVLLTVRI
ncbi:hypothetical protein BC941DRAFT_470050 [Chlamydoabsidia padenii]|nr:hypothetical protein BC941DRAFT_470050 [Chlamydoabsidia padenii]